MSPMSTKELCVLVQNLSKEERDNLVFVSSSFPPPFVNVRLRLSLSVCRRKNPRSKSCGSGSSQDPRYSANLEVGITSACLPWSCSCLGSTGVGKVYSCLFMSFPR